MKLFKAEQCAPCKRLGEYIKKNGIEIETETLTFESLRAGKYSFRTVPSLVLEDGAVISGFPQIRLYLSTKDKHEK